MSEQLPTHPKHAKMIDLHSHTLFSDGCLVPSELARRAEEKGLQALAFTDHVDYSNYLFVLENICRVCEELNKHTKIYLIPGAEITHVPPVQIPALAEKLRRCGAKVIGVHGETITEPVAKGTNSYALESDIDFLAHPGLISEEDVLKAKENEIYLEITTRKGHSITNGHVARLATEIGAQMIVNSDIHEPGDITAFDEARKVLMGAGLNEDQIKTVFGNSQTIVNILKG